MSYGKPGYFSPEQVGRKAMDQRADLFSMGIVLWNALTGERLFDGPSVEEVFDRVLGLPIPAPSTVGLLPPECFDAICLKALARDPADRYQSAEEMLNELREVAMQNGLLGSSAEVAAWVQKMFGRELEVRRLDAIDAFRAVPGGAENAFVKTAVLPAAPAARSARARHASSEPMDRKPQYKPDSGEPHGFHQSGSRSISKARSLLHREASPHRVRKLSLPKWLPREWKLNRKRSTIILAPVIVAIALIALDVRLPWPAARLASSSRLSIPCNALTVAELGCLSPPLSKRLPRDRVGQNEQPERTHSDLLRVRRASDDLARLEPVFEEPRDGLLPRAIYCSCRCTYAGRVFPLTNDEYLIGRSEKADIRIDQGSILPTLHAKVPVWRAGGTVLVDLGLHERHVRQ